MKLLLISLQNPIFPSFWMFFLQPVIIHYVSWIPYYVLNFVGALHFVTSFDLCLGTMRLSVGTKLFWLTLYWDYLFFIAIITLCQQHHLTV